MVLLLVHRIGSYTPLVTEIVSFAAALSTALWIVRNDVAQLVPAAVSFPFDGFQLDKTGDYFATPFLRR